MASEEKISKSNGSSTESVPQSAGPAFMLCVQNTDCDDLEQRKVYLALPDAAAAESGYLRVVDESGEDYLYPARFFVPVEFAAEVAAQWRGTG